MDEHRHRMAQDGTRWRAAIRYSRHMREFWSSDMNRAVVGEVAPQPGESVLDIGAGMGAGVIPAAATVGRGGRVIAVEPTPFMRWFLLARRLVNRHRTRIEILDAVGEQLPIPDATIDAAWAVNVLHHLTDLQALARELQRVLRPGGRALLVDEDFGDPSHPSFDEMRRMHGHHDVVADSRDDADLRHRMVDPDDVAAAMRHGGLRADARRERLAGRPMLRVDLRRPG